MPALTRSLAVAGLVALAVAVASPGPAVARRDRLAPTACTVPPRTAGDIAGLIAAATPMPEPPDEAVPGSHEWVESPAGLPPGEPADPGTVAQITTAAREFAGCLNAGDGPRLAALMTDDAMATGVGVSRFAPMVAAAGTPEPGSGESSREIAWVRVRDVQMLPDGRVSAAVVWGVTNTPQSNPMPEVAFLVFARVGDRWLLDAEISTVSDTDAILRRARQGFNEVDSALYAEPTMAGAKFSIEALVMVGFIGNDEPGAVSCEMFIFERGEDTATVSAFCRAEEALIGRAAYLEVRVFGPRHGSDSMPNSCEDVAPLAASLVFSCTVDVPADTP